jgi:hypothetical protein
MVPSSLTWSNNQAWFHLDSICLQKATRPMTTSRAEGDQRCRSLVDASHAAKPQAARGLARPKEAPLRPASCPEA